MVRTKADRVPTKAVGGKAPSNKAASSTPTRKTSGGSKGRSYSGGNPSHPRETPEWQKPITCFLNQQTSANGMDDNHCDINTDPQNTIQNTKQSPTNCN